MFHEAKRAVVADAVVVTGMFLLCGVCCVGWQSNNENECVVCVGDEASDDKTYNF